jgi:hypothetical protein
MLSGQDLNSQAQRRKKSDHAFNLLYCTGKAACSVREEWKDGQPETLDDPVDEFCYQLAVVKHRMASSQPSANKEAYICQQRLNNYRF